MKRLKMIMALAMTAAISFSMLSVTVFADNINYFQNWTSDKGNGPQNGSTSGANGNTNFNCTINQATGTFNTTWTTTKQNFNNIVGLGWSGGKANRKIGFNLGVFNHTSGSTGCTYLGFYGWTRSPLKEFYIFENWVNYVPNDGTKVGTYTSDGGTYTFYYKNVNGINIDGNGPFIQVISIRDSKRTSGTITLQNHINAWNSNSNTKPGTWVYQTFCVEGYNSTGSANGSVWETN